MSEELEILIDKAIVNGQISERSKELLFKKAEQLEIDPIDFELLLESKIAQKKLSANNSSPVGTTEIHYYKSTDIPPTPPQQISNKEGVVKKCPSCGASVPSFTATCQDCGHEFRGVSTNKITEVIQHNIAEIISKNKDNRLNQISYIKHYISTISVPTSKEDLVEVIAFCYGCMTGGDLHQRNAFKGKFDECMLKLEILAVNDSSLRGILETYKYKIVSHEGEQAIKSKKALRLAVILMLFLIALLAAYKYFGLI